MSPCFTAKQGRVHWSSGRAAAAKTSCPKQATLLHQLHSNFRRFIKFQYISTSQSTIFWTRIPFVSMRTTVPLPSLLPFRMAERRIAARRSGQRRQTERVTAFFRFVVQKKAITDFWHVLSRWNRSPMAKPAAQITNIYIIILSI